MSNRQHSLEHQMSQCHNELHILLGQTFVIVLVLFFRFMILISIVCACVYLFSFTSLSSNVILPTFHVNGWRLDVHKNEKKILCQWHDNIHWHPIEWKKKWFKILLDQFVCVLFCGSLLCFDYRYFWLIPPSARFSEKIRCFFLPMKFLGWFAHAHTMHTIRLCVEFRLANGECKKRKRITSVCPCIPCVWSLLFSDKQSKEKKKITKTLINNDLKMQSRFKEYISLKTKLEDYDDDDDDEETKKRNEMKIKTVHNEERHSNKRWKTRFGQVIICNECMKNWWRTKDIQSDMKEYIIYICNRIPCRSAPKVRERKCWFNKQRTVIQNGRQNTRSKSEQKSLSVEIKRKQRAIDFIWGNRNTTMTYETITTGQQKIAIFLPTEDSSHQTWISLHSYSEWITLQISSS